MCNFMASHPIAVEIFHSGNGGSIDQHPESLAASLTKKTKPVSCCKRLMGFSRLDKP